MSISDSLGKLLVISGPTAVGKGTVVAEVMKKAPETVLSISATTRQPRPNEIEGQSYYFLDRVGFENLIEKEQLLEYALVHQKEFYGTPKEPVTRALAAGKNVILEIDIQGAYQVKKNFPQALLVFLLPPSWEELVSRLQGRGTETPEEQDRRLTTAREELQHAARFDVQITNVLVEDAAQAIIDLF